MGWDEAFFGFLLKKLSRRAAAPPDPSGVSLETEAPILRVLACALTGEPITISAAEGVGGYDGDRLFLPERIALFATADDNRAAYRYRLLATLAARRLGLFLPRGREAETRALSLAAIPTIRGRLEADFPRARELLGGLLCARVKSTGAGSAADTDSDHLFLTLFGELAPSSKKTPEPAGPEGAFAADALSSGTEKKGKPRERTENARFDERKDDENPLVHVFEKILTADEHAGGKKNLDGSDELEDHEEALRELDLRHVIRSRERARSLYKSDAIVDNAAPDLEGDEAVSEPIRYDEWDHSRRIYRLKWCAVSRSTAPAADSALPRPSGAAVKKLRAELEKLMNESRWRGRELDGPEPDLDAATTAVSDRRSGLTPSNRVYRCRRPAARDFAAIILIDTSLSTDSWVSDQHVIRVERETLLTLAEVLNGIADNVSVAAFSSNTRRDCRYVELKTFREPWTVVRRREAALKPAGYTRIGPALRHASAELVKTGAKRKLLLLISDGKPTDYDRYEGTYGIEDVRQAVKEAHAKGLRVHSLAIDAEAKFYLPRMFGPGGYQILPHPRLLAPALSKIFVRCLR